MGHPLLRRRNDLEMWATRLSTTENTSAENVILEKERIQMSEPVQVIFSLDETTSASSGLSEEAIWCLPTMSSNSFVVDNIPFYATDISMGDEIKAEVSSAKLRFMKVLRKSKNTTVRLFAMQGSAESELIPKMQSFGGLTEKMEGSSLVAVSLPPTADLAGAFAYLDSESEKRRIGFEELSVRYR